MPVTKGFRILVDEAMAQVTTYSVEQVLAKMTDTRTQIVDIREVRELTGVDAVRPLEELAAVLGRRIKRRVAPVVFTPLAP